MPVIQTTPTTPPQQQPVKPLVVADEYRGVTVDTRYEAATSLLTHIEGASWTVNYYSQVLGLDNALSSQNLDRPATYQQYRLIVGLELKVTTDLKSAQDQQGKEFNITGQANLYQIGLIPNEGDCFIADIGDGREAVFEITSTEKRTIYKDGAFIVDYKAIAYAEQDARIADLNMKTVETVYYDRDGASVGGKPLVHGTAWKVMQNLRKNYVEILDFYFSRFVSRNLKTLILPGQDYIVYDPMLTKNVLHLFRNDSHPNIKFIRELNVGEDDNYDTPGIWSAFMKRRRKELVGGMTQAGVVSVRQFSWQTAYNSIRYSGVEYAVYPSDPYKSEDYVRQDQTKFLASWNIKTTRTRLTSLADLIQIEELDGLPSLRVPAINPTLADSYIFSAEFYANAPQGQSGLELMVQRYLDEKAYDMPTLNQLCETYTSWTPMDQFYQLPFLLALVREAIGRIE